MPFGPSVHGDAGPKGEGGLDDATGASGAAGGASMKQTSNTVDLSECRRASLLGGHCGRAALVRCRVPRRVAADCACLAAAAP